MSSFQTRDSGAREEYAGGMVRDTNEGKARFDLCWPDGVPYEEQLLTRFALLMARGADKYGNRNWERASDEAAWRRYRESAMRHLYQWLSGDREEDHAAAVIFNLMGAEYVDYKMQQPKPIQFEDGSKGFTAAVQYLSPEYASLLNSIEADDEADQPCTCCGPESNDG